MIALFLALTLLQDPIKLDPDLPAYQHGEKLRGTLTSVGSDTMSNLMTFWAEEMFLRHPEMPIQIEGKGSRPGPPSLMADDIEFAPASLPLTPRQLEAFREKYGYVPTAITVAIDAIGVYVNVDNPLEELTLEQVDAIWSKSRKRGGKDLRTWGDLGLTGAWGEKKIDLYGRNSASGTYTFFKMQVLQTGDFKDEVREQSGTAVVIGQVAADPQAMGFGGLGYGQPKTRALRLAPKSGEKSVAPTLENSRSGAYPLARPLMIYFKKGPDHPLDPRVREFLKLALSKEGQEIVIKDGYFPLTAAMAAQERKKLE